MDDWCIKLHERDILALKSENYELNEKIQKNSKEIEKLRNYNREIKGR